MPESANLYHVTQWGKALSGEELTTNLKALLTHALIKEASNADSCEVVMHKYQTTSGLKEYKGKVISQVINPSQPKKSLKSKRKKFAHFKCELRKALYQKSCDQIFCASCPFLSNFYFNTNNPLSAMI